MDNETNDGVEAGRRLGHDLFRWSRKLDEAWPGPVREGYGAARETGRSRRPADRHVRKWLQLRLGALQRGRAFDPAIDADLLRSIDTERCPVTRRTLTHGTLSDTDWSVDRLNNDGAYAACNLAVMSVSANRAKAARGFGEVLDLARGPGPAHGLEPVEWRRLAALMLGPCHADRAAAAPLIAQVVPIPPRTVHLAAQRVQHVLAYRSRTAADKNALVKHFRTSCRKDAQLVRLRELAERVHERTKRLEHPCDVWLDDRTMDVLRVWKEALGTEGWATVADSSTQLVGVRSVSAGRIAAWRLPVRGFTGDRAGERRPNAP